MNSQSRQLVYLIGAPGTGKSTLFERVFCPYALKQEEKPFPYVLTPFGIVLGRLPGDWIPATGGPDNPLRGTDALEYRFHPDVIRFLARYNGNVFAEGDRLMGEKFFSQTETLGYTLRLFGLTAPSDVLEWRRKERGSKQSEVWIKGRNSKVRRAAMNRKVDFMDATLSPNALADLFRSKLIKLGLIPENL